MRKNQNYFHSLIDRKTVNFVGEKVWVRFPDAGDGGTKEHGGRITGTWRTGRYWRWEILYDDGCKEDWNEKELMHYYVNGYSSRYGSPGPPTASVAKDRVDGDGAEIVIDFDMPYGHPSVGMANTMDDHTADHKLKSGNACQLKK